MLPTPLPYISRRAFVSLIAVSNEAWAAKSVRQTETVATDDDSSCGSRQPGRSRAEAAESNRVLLTGVTATEAAKPAHCQCLTLQDRDSVSDQQVLCAGRCGRHLFAWSLLPTHRLRNCLVSSPHPPPQKLLGLFSPPTASDKLTHTSQQKGLALPHTS